MKTENFVYALMIVLFLLVIVFSYFTLINMKKNEDFTELFFIPKSYSDILNEDRNVSFSYKIINNESKSMNYNVEIFYDNVTVESKNLFLEDKQTYQENYSFIVPENVTLPLKISVVLRNLNENIDFWIWEIR